MGTDSNTKKIILFIVQNLQLRRNRGPPNILHVTVKTLSSYKSGMNKHQGPF